jgi:hypothetical protein
LPKLLEISQQNGFDAEAIIGDAGYSEKKTLK